MALCLGTYGDPRGVGVSYERSTPVGFRVWVLELMVQASNLSSPQATPQKGAKYLPKTHDATEDSGTTFFAD